MFFPKKIFCRSFQTAFRIALPFLPYREPQVLPSCKALGRVCRQEAISTALIVTDAGIVANGLLAPLEMVLHKIGISYTIYEKTKPNPTDRNVEEALRLYHKNHCDALIAIGGGSSMDCAKAVGARVVYPQKSVAQLKGILRIRRKLPTLIAIPTTAGTGSEATLAAVITEEKQHQKYALMSFPLIPRYAVLDAALTYSLPPQLTATTGLDALTHAIEAYIGRSGTRETRKLALDATRRIFAYLEIAYQEGENHTAREEMLHAAYQAGYAFSKSYVGYIHALAHALGGQYGTPHGLANAVLLPNVLEAYGSSIQKKLHQLAIAAGISFPAESHQLGAEKFIRAIREMNEAMGIPKILPEIRQEDIPRMAKHAEKEANPLYPVPKLWTAKELEHFYRQIAK